MTLESGVQFDEISHVYTFEGQIIPSVTTLMKPLSKTVYADVDPVTLEAAARKGTIVHNAIENWMKFGIEDIADEQRNYFDAYKKYEDEKKPKLLYSEVRLFHKYLRYAGTADSICEIDGKTYIVDYKTTANLNPMLTRVQLEAYKQAVENMGVKVQGKAIVQLKKDGTYKFEEHELVDGEAWKAFASLLNLHNYILSFKK